MKRKLDALDFGIQTMSKKQKQAKLTMDDFLQASKILDFTTMKLFLQDKPDQDSIFMQLFLNFEDKPGLTYYDQNQPSDKGDVNWLCYVLYDADFFKNKSLIMILNDYHPKLDPAFFIGHCFQSTNWKNHCSLVPMLINHPKMNHFHLLQLIHVTRICRIQPDDLSYFLNNSININLSIFTKSIEKYPEMPNYLRKWIADEPEPDWKKVLMHMLLNNKAHFFFRSNILLPELWHQIGKNLVDIELDSIQKAGKKN